MGKGIIEELPLEKSSPSEKVFLDMPFCTGTKKSRRLSGRLRCPIKDDPMQEGDTKCMDNVFSETYETGYNKKDRPLSTNEENPFLKLFPSCEVNLILKRIRQTSSNSFLKDNSISRDKAKSNIWSQQDDISHPSNKNYVRPRRSLRLSKQFSPKTDEYKEPSEKNNQEDNQRFKKITKRKSFKVSLLKNNTVSPMKGYDEKEMQIEKDFTEDNCLKFTSITKNVNLPQEHDPEKKRYLNMDLDLKLDSLNIADCVEVKRRKLSETSTSFLEETETEEDLEEDMSTEFDCEGETTLRRSTRRKIRPLDTQNRRTLTKPRKIIDGSNMTEVKKYYLDKRVKRLPSNLETIFEEPQSEAFMSGRKFKRCITFTDNLKASNKLKTKKRVMKAKKLSAKKRVNSKKKVTLELLLEKLSSLENADF